ncbi:MAG: M4 family metallopeptidase [Propionibacteriaceae bacterium]
MPDHLRANGLSSYSVHASEQATEPAGRSLRAELDGAPTSATGSSDVDPETAARRLLHQALASDAVPSFTAPVSDGVTSEFRTINTETVPLTGTRIVKFRQTVHDIPVYGSLLSVELDESNGLVGIDSALGEPTGVDPVAAIAPVDALAAAVAAPDGYTPRLTGVVPRLHYYFDAATSTWRLAYLLQDVPVTTDRSTEPASGQPSTLEPPRIVDYVVDAHQGTVVAVLPRTPSVAADTQTGLAAGEPQTGTDAMGVERHFVASREGGALVLVDPEHNVRTYDFGFGDPAVDGDTLPGTAVANPPVWSPGAVSAHANAVAVSDFLRTVLFRDNIDDRGTALVSSVNCVVADATPGHQEWHNAFWNGAQMVYGQALHGAELRTLAANVDVVAHEMFHGVTDHTSRLEYAVQPGALNESYSDIFGTIVANLGADDPRRWDWELGENLLADDRPLRDLSDPARFDQPAHMDDFQVLPNTRAGDWGGVHVNSGIHNKAAYLVLTAAGDDGVLRLTPGEVAAVFYLALTQRLSRTSQFVDSRRAVVASARSLFRRLPAAERQGKITAIEAAFEAVGILAGVPAPAVVPH